MADFASRFLGQSAPGQDARHQLSGQELKIFKLLGQGFSRASIARKLRLGLNTVGTYRARIKEKLRLSGPDALRRAAIQWRSPRPEPRLTPCRAALPNSSPSPRPESLT